MRPHAALEEALAAFKSAQAALVFGSGFAAGTGVIPAILDKGDVVVLDKLSHACLIDGARASGATLRVYGHNRVDQLEDILRASRAKSPEARILVVTESVFSMDGDSCPLAEIVEAKDRHGAWLLLDEAHATGVIGPGGRGLAAALGLSSRIEFQMGTLSKALGCHGGFVAASRVMVDLLINRCRPFIYATAPPPLISAACLAALEICSSGEGDQRRVALDANRLALARVLRAPQPSISPIFPFIVGAEDEAVALAASLLDAGILAPAIRYPTVAKGSARLRFTVTAGHRPDDLAALGAAITACGQV
jgi:8-amino-7-oxononanoate synthase